MSEQTPADFSNGKTKAGRDADKLATMLTCILADSYALMVKNFFASLHRLTEEHYDNLFVAVDALTKRIRNLGYPAPKSFVELAGRTTIDETTSDQSAEQITASLLRDHETLISRLRSVVDTAIACKDAVTASLARERMAFHEKAIAMLRSVRTAPSH